MKKRILSIILVSIMLLSAIPAFTVGANPAIETVMDYKYYRTVVTSDTIIMDGELDEIYKSSQKIEAESWIAGDSSKVGFEAYAVLTLRGIYVWAEIKDGSLDKSDSLSASEADRFQIYLKMNDGRDLSWGWYEVDYNDKVSKHSIMSGDDIEGTYENKWNCVYSTTELCDADAQTVKLADGSGWRSEMFIPFAVELVNFTNYDLSVGFQVQNGNSGSADYGVCYDRSEIANAWYRYDVYKPVALVKEIDRSPSYAPNYVFNMSDIMVTEDLPVQGGLVNNAVYVSGESFSLDGRKDSFYSEHAKVPMVVWHTYYSNSQPVATPVATMGDVYVAFDDSNLYVYYERYDKSFGVNSGEHFSISYLFNDGGSATSGHYSIRLADGAISHLGAGDYGWPGSKASGISQKITSLGNNYYGVEVKIPLPSGVKTKLSANNASFEMGLAFSTTEYTSADTRAYQAGSTRDVLDYYSYESMKGNYPHVMLSKSFTDATPGSILGASLSLGSDITVNYYANIGSADVNNAYMRFTRGESEYIAYPRKIKNSASYMFSFKGIAPQTLDDNIKAELVVGGKVISAYDNYSARQNCVNLMSKQENASNVKLSNLIKSLLSYGAAAQGYANYKTDKLVNNGYEVVLKTPEENESVRSVGAPISDDFKMTAVGVYFDSNNKIYVKFVAPTLNGVSVTMNGVRASVERHNDEYIAYSDAIPVSQFGTTYTIVLSNGSSSQTATYSINSYAYAKLSSTNPRMVELAKATYTYGDCAKKYAGVGNAIYTVMTYNDADNNSPYKDNYGDVMTIINDISPDLVGMQEIQQSHVIDYYLKTNLKDEGDGCYSGEIGNYAGVFYWSTPAEPSEGADDYDRKYAAYKGEMGKPSGDMILYRKDKFEIVKDNNGNEVKGRLWLSHTPDTASILPTTEYTQCVMYLLLRDKQTGNEFLFINLHASYLEANREQIEILMDLFEAGGAKNSYLQKHAGLDMTSYRKIYTADWNCTKFTAGYNVMNANGYSATEELLGNIYKPATTVNGGYIDFCFVKSSEFKTLKYKVINDHSLSLTTSDHYPVFSKIAWVEEYEDEPLVAIQNGFPVPPDNPTYDNFDDFFFTEDDTDGFWD